MRLYSTFSKVYKVAIVGSGPAGFYTAHKLLKSNVQIDLIEAMPVPFGLVRHGVAPDHPEVKNVQHKFEKVAQNPNVSFFGNVWLDKDISIADLRKIYDVVVFAYGASQDKKLNIPNEDLEGIYGARDFVGWYNGYPSLLKVDLESTDTAVIVGMGNVALDLARVLLSPVDVLAKTDITENALEILKKSKIERVVLLGRRGPVQVSFTAKELREMFKIPDVACQLDVDWTKDQITRFLPAIKQDKSKLRLMNLLLSKAVEQNKQKRVWDMRFLSSPVKFHASSDNPTKVGRMTYCRNILTSDLMHPRAKATNELHDIDTGLVLKSIGYEIVPANGLPFDRKHTRIPNTHGRVLVDDKIMRGMYVSGWLKTGPKGTIATTMMESYDTANAIMHDLNDNITIPTTSSGGKEELIELLRERQVESVSFDDWKIIEAEEQRRGELKGKPREKITDIHEMLSIIRKESK